MAQQEELTGAETELLALLNRFRDGLDALIAGISPKAKIKPPALAPGFRIPGTAVTELVRPPVGPATLEDIVKVLFTIGVKERPYDEWRFSTAKQPLTILGGSEDIGHIADISLIIPSIDAQIDFDTHQIEPNTPVQSGGTVLRHPARHRRINYKATSTTLQGTVSYFSYWFVN